MQCLPVADRSVPRVGSGSKGRLHLQGANEKTIEANKKYDTKGFVTEMRRLGVTLHAAQIATATATQPLLTAPPTTRIDAQSINARRGIKMVFIWI